MLPGFRFLFAAIVLSMSILIFGLGAAALLRAAHEQFVSNPSWHATPETMFAQQSEATRPVVALLHVDPPPVEREQAPDNVPSAAPPADQAPAAAAPAEPQTTAALSEQPLPAEVAKPEMPAAQDSPPTEIAPAQTEAAVAAEAPAPAAETRIAATEQALPPPANEVAAVASEATPAAPDPAFAPTSAAADIAAIKIATLGGPPVAIEAQPPAKSADAKSDGSAINKRAQSRRAAQRRKIAARARLARQVTQQPASPFTQPFAPTPARTP
ncbi:hypothetical protein SAMN05444159_2324 [Bradyrhizobium lablabi]|uniref:Uncharacterized protein n=1 Tax=Bradyrhizobium lablabi TaxID=722472 RepID=A0A1M6PF64_9BRAD|nr:hypothetical protein [Bradyrhizobium lablabi]SHK06554.1 hypothetical protein SAMN05444159_2324 [Bradyrhizobium lablabi]